MAYTVGQVAQFAGVTVRTLHHYDEIGLLSPSDRTSAGYRRYDDADLERLQQILFYRELGFSLEEIATILDDPRADPAEHLRRQHELLTVRVKRLQEMVTAIEFAMEASKLGIQLTPEEIGTILDDPRADPDEHLRRQHELLTVRVKRLQEMVTAIEFAMEARKLDIQLTPEERFEVFGDFNPEEYAAEAEERWGGSDAYRESTRRAGRYGKQEWLQIKAANEEWGRRLVAVMESGAPADSAAAMELAEEHRQLISRWFYECSYEIHTGLAEMYMADPRFTAYYEKIRPGMAAYLSEAIHANAITRA